jgi:hypothetical protein
MRQEQFELAIARTLEAVDDNKSSRTANHRDNRNIAESSFQPESEKPHPDGPYRIEDGHIVRVKQTKEGPIVERLCNFEASIEQEILYDDGAEATRSFTISGRLDSGIGLPTVQVPTSKFNSLSWVTENWGARAIIRAGQSARDSLREAIQCLSPDVVERRVFAHTGWREVDGEWLYLTANGAVGSEKRVEVDLGSELSRYCLPKSAENRVQAMRSSLELLKIAPLSITAPIWAAVYRAPLASIFPLDLSVWLEGSTGSLKSTLAALFLCHFGQFSRTTLPGAWSSTANQLERRAFVLKDTMFVVDDYAPSSLDRELEVKATRLVRSQGNLAGRGRLRADLTERPAFYPRGLILSTGEQHPVGQSILARTLVVEIERKLINLNALSVSQINRDRLAHAMAGYISWLAPQMADLPGQLQETFEGTRSRALQLPHLRIPEALAHLWLGLHSGINYAEDIKACDSSEAQDLRKSCWETFVNLVTQQAQLVEEERPSRRFLRVLSTLLTQGRAILLSKNEPGGDCPLELLGWRDDEWIYLIPEASFRAVSRFCKDTNEAFPITEGRLRRDLKNEGVSFTDPERLTATVAICGHTERVLKLRATHVESLTDEGFPLPITTDHHDHRSQGGEEVGL